VHTKYSNNAFGAARLALKQSLVPEEKKFVLNDD
jgi:hypothetical protein